MSDPTLKECWTITHMGPCGENCITGLTIGELVYVLRMKTYNNSELREKVISDIRGE